jgi:hypothetical protein
MHSNDARRRMMPPPLVPSSRSRTPQPPVASIEAEEEKDETSKTRDRSSTLSSAASMPDLKVAGGKRPRFIQRASQYLIANYGKPKEPNYFTDIQPRQLFQPVPLEQVINSLQNDLLSNILKPLEVDRNGPILRVLEGYMQLKTERELLADKLNTLVKRHYENVDMLEAERKTWKEDEALYNAEIKRLEILIAEGRTGLSQVALARQQSLIRGKAGRRPRGDSGQSAESRSQASTMSARNSAEEQVPSQCVGYMHPFLILTISSNPSADHTFPRDATTLQVYQSTSLIPESRPSTRPTTIKVTRTVPSSCGDPATLAQAE